MKILAVTNLFPPHQADTDDFRSQNVTDALRERGHTLRVLTSEHRAAPRSKLIDARQEAPCMRLFRAKKTAMATAAEKG